MCLSRVFREGTRNVQGHWTNHGSNNIKKFFDTFADHRKMDPLVASNWYNIGVKDIHQLPEGRTVIGIYDGSVIRALLDVYPDIGLNQLNFKYLPKKYWQSKIVQREFFCNLAQKQGFDPLVVSNWYNVPLSTIHNQGKSAKFIFNYYGGSALRALMSAFPEINFDNSKFGDKFWKTETNRKEFFDSLAVMKNFDPFIASNWYNITVNDVVQIEGGNKVLSAYGGSLYRALSQVYPSLKLNEGMFLFDKPTRKRIMEQFAAIHQFDPSHKDRWLPFSKQNLDYDKALAMVLKTCYGGSITDAVADIYGTQIV